MKSLKYEFGDFSCNMRLRNLMLPSQITIVLTNKCNLKCKFCSVCTDELQTMDFEFAKKVLLYCSENGIHNICISGGEPILYPQINELIQYAGSLKLKVLLTTNGLLLDRINLDSIEMLYGIGVSLHGTEQTHDAITGMENSYKITIANLDKAKKTNANINYTFSNLNSDYSEMEHVANIALQNGMSMTVARINREGRAIGGGYDAQPNLLVENVSQLHLKGYNIRVSNCIAPCSVKQNLRYLTHGCSAGISFVGVEPNGDVKVCPTASFSIGNLYNEDLLNIWNSNIMKKMRSLNWLPIACKSCYEILKCRGGCKIENYNNRKWPAFGDILASETFDEIWTNISNINLKLTLNCIRKEDGYSILLGSHLRFCNDSVISILKKIDGTRTGNQLLDQADEHHREQVKMLLIALYRDSVIKTIKG